jgi:HAD superfamily hydrolase (TIGR01509 family)
MTRLAAVLFDMDGLLVDSEPLWYPVEAQAFARLGAPRRWTFEDSRQLVGNDLEVSARMLLDAAGAPDVSPDQVVSWFVEAMAARLSEGLPWKPGARELLGAVRAAGLPAALVSMSYRRLLDLVLAGVPDGAFAASVAGDEVTHGKPHPEPYLRACELLDVAPPTAVVLEDSPTGARSGQAAGCVVVQVPDLVAVPPDAHWHSVASLTELDVAALRDLVQRAGRPAARRAGPAGQRSSASAP